MAEKNSVHTLIEDCAAEMVRRDYRGGTPTYLAKGTRFAIVDSAKVIPGHGLVRRFYLIQVGSDRFLVEESALDAKLEKGE
jgi:hypothetical protein